MRTILFIIALLSSITQYTFSQTLPAPIRNYPLNGNFKDIAKGKNGTIEDGTYQWVADRFGQREGAIKFDGHAYIKTPGFFEGSDISNGYTISLWIYIEKEYHKNQGYLPWSGLDTYSQAFFAGTLSNGHYANTLLGFTRHGDRAVIDRYVEDLSNRSIKDWGIWFWDPVNFTDRIGWYHIVISYHPAQVYLYMFYPTGQMASGLYYFGLQDLSKANTWGLGGHRYTPFPCLDDVKIYDRPLERSEIMRLHAMEVSPFSLDE